MRVIKALSAFLNLMFGCMHSNYSFPQTPKASRSSQAANLTGMYVVCLECGKEFPYDWREMKVIAEPPAKPRPAAQPETFPGRKPAKTFANKAA